MQPNSILFAGADLASGRKPITFAALDGDLKTAILEKWDLPTALSCLQEYKNICLVINQPSRLGQRTYEDFKNEISAAGFRAFSKEAFSKQWFETNATDCYREWIGQNPLPRRSFEGRLQRALTLYDQGVRMEDPMEIFEEITRYKLLQGKFRLDTIYASRELDALASAYLAWMSFNRPERIVVKGEVLVPASG